MKVYIGIEGEVDAAELNTLLHKVIDAINLEPDEFDRLRVDETIELEGITVGRSE